MAAKRPLVYGDDGIEELQTDDILIAEVADLIEFPAAGALAVGDAVYIGSDGRVGKAKADASATMPGAGFTIDAATLQDDIVRIQSKGSLDGFTGLTPGKRQFIDPSTAGALTETVPTTAGHFAQEMAIAKSSTEILIDIKQPVKRG
jgi:hypothetical protein